MWALEHTAPCSICREVSNSFWEGMGTTLSSCWTDQASLIHFCHSGDLRLVGPQAGRRIILHLPLTLLYGCWNYTCASLYQLYLWSTGTNLGCQACTTSAFIHRVILSPLSQVSYNLERAMTWVRLRIRPLLLEINQSFAQEQWIILSYTKSGGAFPLSTSNWSCLSYHRDSLSFLLWPTVFFINIQ